MQNGCPNQARYQMANKPKTIKKELMVEKKRKREKNKQTNKNF